MILPGRVTHEWMCRRKEGCYVIVTNVIQTLSACIQFKIHDHAYCHRSALECKQTAKIGCSNWIPKLPSRRLGLARDRCMLSTLPWGKMFFCSSMESVKSTLLSFCHCTKLAVHLAQASIFDRPAATLLINNNDASVCWLAAFILQALDKGLQKELPDIWLTNGNPWEIRRPEIKYKIGFYGTVDNFKWTPEEVVSASFPLPLPSSRCQWLPTIPCSYPVYLKLISKLTLPSSLLPCKARDGAYLFMYAKTVWRSLLWEINVMCGISEDRSASK